MTLPQAISLTRMLLFQHPGTYSFTLSANDGYIISNSEPADVSVNYPPVVTASVQDDVPDYPAYRGNLFRKCHKSG